MTLNKAKRRYPEGSKIKYLNDSERTIKYIDYEFNGIEPGKFVERERTIKQGDVLIVEWYIIDENTRHLPVEEWNIIGIYVDVTAGELVPRPGLLPLLFKEDTFTREVA